MSSVPLGLIHGDAVRSLLRAIVLISKIITEALAGYTQQATVAGGVGHSR